MLIEENIKKELTSYRKKIVQKGLAVAGGGNISARKKRRYNLSFPQWFALNEVSENQWLKVELKTGKT